MTIPYDFAGCTTMNCPRDADMDLPVELSKSDLVQDTSGNYWCSTCQNRYALMNWGKEHNWPEVRVQGQRGTYAAADGYEAWFTSVAMGNQDLIDAMGAELFSNEEEEKNP